MSKPSQSSYRRFLAVSDFHVPYHSRRYLQLVREFAADFKPHETLMLGDGLDAESFSRFPVHRPAPLSREFRACNEILDWLKPTYYFEGNHEERLRRAGLVNEAWIEVLDPRTQLRIDARHCYWVPYHNRKGIVRLGHLSFLHGFYCGQYAARSHADAYDCCVFGHTHRVQIFQPPAAIDNHVGYNIGCLCDLDRDWTSTNSPNAWMNAFAFGYIHRNSFFNIYIAQLVGHHFVINGKDYLA